MRKVLFKSFSNRGFSGQVIGIETDIRNGFPGFDIVGLPDNAVKESRERVKAALRNSGFKFPQSHILISLYPASIPKTGSLLDLPIALSIIFCSSNKTENYQDTISIMAAGELSLNGEILDDPSAMGADVCAKKSGCSFCLVPYDSKSPNTFTVHSLAEAFLKCGELIENVPDVIHETTESKQIPQLFPGIMGMEHEKEVISVAAAGWHSLLLFGPPGVGKTTLSNSVVNLLPDLFGSNLDEVNHIYGLSYIERDNPRRPPCRTLPHDCSMAQFTSGRNSRTPGEGALSHCGVLILDELNSYSRKLTDSVRESFDRTMTVSSKGGEMTVFPSSFLLVANMDVCPCGGLGNPQAICTCTAQKISAFWASVGSALIDRFDIRCPVVQYKAEVQGRNSSKPDSWYRDRIDGAISRQEFRYKDLSNIKLNGQLHTIKGSISDFLPREVELLSKLEEGNSINFRVFNSLVTLARTLADLDDREEVTDEDFEQAKLFKKYGNGDYYWREIR